MTAHSPSPDNVDTALLLLQRLGVSPDDLRAAPIDRPPMPTFAEYIPTVSALVSAGTRGVYAPTGSASWPNGPTASEIKHLVTTVQAEAVAAATPVVAARPPNTWWRRCAASTGTPKTTN